jgi:hypothetical protein
MRHQACCEDFKLADMFFQLIVKPKLDLTTLLIITKNDASGGYLAQARQHDNTDCFTLFSSYLFKTLL